MFDWIVLLLAVLPAILLVVYIYRKDKFEKEPFGMLLKAFFFGCLTTIPASLLEGVLQTVYAALLGNGGGLLGYSLYTGFVVAGFSEELFKLLFLAWAVWRSRHFTEYFDGIVYAASVSLGFACVENILYVFGGTTYSEMIHTGIVRAVLSVPAHFLFGVTMGYFFSMAKFEPAKRGQNLRKALFVPLALHGTFDALIFMYSELLNDVPVVGVALMVGFFAFDVWMWRFCVRKLRYMQMKSEVQYWEKNSFDETENGETL